VAKASPQSEALNQYTRAGQARNHNQDEPLHTGIPMQVLSHAFLDLYFCLSSDGTIEDYSAARDTDLYLSPQEFMGRRMQDVLPPAVGQQFQDALIVIKQTGRSLTLDYALPMNGSHRYFEARLLPINLGQVAVLVRDVTDHKQAQAALQEAESKFRSIFENAVEGIFQTTPAGRYLNVNPALARIYGYASTAELIANYESIGSQLYCDPNRRAEFVRLIEKHDCVADFEAEIYRKDGSVIWISENARAVRDADGQLIYFEGFVEDITVRKHAEQALRESENRLRDIVEHSSNLFFSRTPDHVFTFLSPQVRHFLDCDPNDALLPWTRFMTDNPINQEGLLTVQRAIDTGQPQPVYELELQGMQGRKIWVEVNEAPVTRDGQTVAIVGALIDITKRHAIEQQLKYQAFHDSLTDLPNRVLFMDRLEHALARSKRQKLYLAVLFLDLDRFKIINDSLGHEVGDQLLQAVSGRLRRCVRPGDTVARLGGDEFTILMEDVRDIKDTIYVAERIAEELHSPFNLQGHQVFVTTSIGIATSHTTGTNSDDLIRDADVAMYRAKRKGPSRYEVYDPEMNARALERLNLETDLWQAVRRDELRVHYQPKIRLDTQQLAGFEALVRWEHPHQGMISPLDFIPLAEETGMILSIGHWVLREACRQAKVWQNRFSPMPLQMSVNISARQLQQANLVREISEVLQETGLHPHCLKLEITESVVMEDAESTIRMLRDLKRLGVELAIDDFGTGYSSLSYLRRFPVDNLKIDRSFISKLEMGTEDTEIVRAIITLGQALGLLVTAEGVETSAQVSKLLSLGCNWAQGYYYSKPLPNDSMMALLEQVFR